MPARTRDDLPLPEVPTTARKRFVRSSCNSAAVCSSRPKNRWCSSLRNGRRPGNGLVFITEPQRAQRTQRKSANDAFDAVFEDLDLEVDEQSQAKARGFQV